MAQKNSQKIQALHEKFQTYGKNAREWMRKCIMMLPEIERERVWEKKGFGSLAEYAGKLAGMSHKTVIDGLRIMQLTENMPAILRVIAKRGINCVKPIAALLRLNNQIFWAEKAAIMSQHALQAYVQEMKYQHDPMIPEEAWLDKGRIEFQIPTTKNSPSLDIFGEGALSEITNFPQHEAIPIPNLNEASVSSRGLLKVQDTIDLQNAPKKKIVAMELDEEVVQRLEKLRGTSAWNELMKEFLEMRERVIAEKQERIIEQSSVASGATSEAATRHIPAAIVRFVLERSRGLCEFTLCKRKYDILHHTQRFALEQVHDPSRIVALCKAHERVVHLGLVENERLPACEWRVVERADVNDERYVIDSVVQRIRVDKLTLRDGQMREHRGTLDA